MRPWQEEAPPQESTAIVAGVEGLHASSLRQTKLRISRIGYSVVPASLLRMSRQISSRFVPVFKDASSVNGAIWQNALRGHHPSSGIGSKLPQQR